MDQWRRNLDDEKRIFGNVDLTEVEKRIAELKEDQYSLVQKLRKVEETEKAYQFPDTVDDEQPLSSKDRLLNKLKQKYVEDKGRSGQPEMT